MSGSWLDPVLRAAEESDDVLVVCRTSVSVRAVLRALAARGRTGGPRGFAGLQVTTIRGLLHSSLPAELVPAGIADDPLPIDHEWSAMLRDRPRLTSLLRRHVERVHLTLAAGHLIDGLRPNLRDLAASGWARTALAAHGEQILARARPKAVFAIGFGEAPSTGLGTVGHFERAFLSVLGAVAVVAPSRREPAPIRARRLPDVAAEARAIVAEVLAAQDVARDGILVLVPDTATDERVRSALLRNGVPVGDDGASPLARHALVALLAPLLPLFASRGAERVHGEDLLRMLITPVLSHAPPRAGIVPVPGIDPQRASVRQIRQVIAGCGRATATLGDWLASLDQIEARADRDHDEASRDERAGAASRLVAVRIVRARVATLALHAGGNGTLADVARLVVDLKLSDPTDRHGQAIIAALRDERFLPADADFYASALYGAVASGRIDEGVQILPYHAYDGRDSELLLLAGVHDKGLGAAPRPDPFLRDDDGRLLGIPSPREAVLERIALARAAAARAIRAPMAFLTTHDGTGRAVVPPLDLPLLLDDSERQHSHGLSFDLPERRDRLSLISGDGQRDASTLQVDAEWVRAGVTEGPRPESPLEFDMLTETLPDYLERYEDHLPPRLRAWLGTAGVYPGASVGGLPPGFRLSASRASAFSQCLWRAYAQTALALQAPETVEEDLDASEIGSALHTALQRAAMGVRWIVPTAAVPAARAALLARLVAETRASLDEQANNRPASVETAAMSTARNGLAARWNRHWAHYVRARIVGFEAAQEAVLTALFKNLRETPAFEEAVGVLSPGFSLPQRKFVADGLFDALVDAAGDIGRLRTDLVVARVGVRTVERTRALMDARPAAVKALCELARDAASAIEYHSDGDLEVVGLEVSFGRAGDVGEPMWLQLGDAPVEVRGQIDVVDRRHGGRAAATSTYRVGDFKTGALAGTRNQIVMSMVRPQLSFYALALAERGPLHAHPPPAVTEEVYYDQVRSLERVSVPFSSDTLDHARVTLGRVLARPRDGEWPLLPHPDGCPIRGAKGAYCDFQEICRLRGTFAPEDDSR